MSIQNYDPSIQLLVPTLLHHTHTGFSKWLRESDWEAQGMSGASWFQRKLYLLPHQTVILTKVMQFSQRMLLSSLKQQLEEEKGSRNDLTFPEKPQLGSGRGGIEGWFTISWTNCLI